MRSQAKKRIIPVSVFNMLGVCMIVALFAMIQAGASVYAYADTRLSLSDNLKKLSLVQQAMSNPQLIDQWAVSDLQILLNDPMLKRREDTITAWTYHGDSCAMDVYVEAGQGTPNYIEFRPLVLNFDIQIQYESTDVDTQKLYCLKDILEAQGVNTSSDFARQPLPSWDSPYSVYSHST